MTDWNPFDPDAVHVVYDLSGWSIDQQAELASALADAEIPHTWSESELIVPEEQEQAADLLIAEVEARLGIVDDPGGSGPAPTDDLGAEPLDPIELAEGVAATEYDLTEWTPTDVMALTHALTRSRIPFRWEVRLLLVGTSDEESVEPVMDLIERGEYVDTDTRAGAGAQTGGQLPFETLTTFFLAGERLRNDPLDADGLQHLLAATDLADPEHPPYGVQPRIWQRTCALAEQLADALVGSGDEPVGTTEPTEPTEIHDGSVADQLDYDLAVDTAAQLHDLLRPYV
jgi:hypothetical protein